MKLKRWLARSLLLLSATASAGEGFEHARGIIGLLPLPEVFGNVACERYQPQDIMLFRTPASPTPMGRIHVTSPWAFAPSGGGCQGLEVSVSLAEAVPSEARLPTLEHSYEAPAAIVSRRDGQWYRIALATGHAWVRIRDDARFLPVAQLLMGSLSYLRRQGRPGLHADPEGGRMLWSASPNDQRIVPVAVRALREVSGRLWVQVSLLDQEPCTQQSTGVAPLTGWLPFHNANAMPQIWFHSRGC